MSILKIKHLHVAYFNKDVLKNINLRINLGEKVLLIGANGAGKSTLLKTIAGILKPKKGKIIFEGEDISLLSPNLRVGKGIVYLKQERDVFPSLTVKENLELACFELNKSEFNRRLEEILYFFPSLKDELDVRVGILSGGQRRSVAISMIFIKHPKLLLLDEPTAGLAPTTASKLLNTIEKFQQKKEITNIIAEHNLTLIIRIMKHVLIMREGRIVLDEPSPNKLLQYPEKLESYFFG